MSDVRLAGFGRLDVVPSDPANVDPEARTRVLSAEDAIRMANWYLQYARDLPDANAPAGLDEILSGAIGYTITLVNLLDQT